jgi:hypothetical protein
MLVYPFLFGIFANLFSIRPPIPSSISCIGILVLQTLNKETAKTSVVHRERNLPSQNLMYEF